MFWVDNIVNQIQKKFHKEIDAGEELVIRDEKTGSGRIHVGSMVGVAMHGTIADALSEANIPNKFFYEINDTAPMDGLPKDLNQEEYKKHMGKPLFSIPAPDKKSKNFPEYFAKEFISVIHDVGFNPEIYYSSELYFSGRMNDVIRIALEKADIIRKIYKDISGSHKDSDWLPLNAICEKCGKVGTTKVTSFDGKKIKYICQKDSVDWAQGCEHEGEISPFDGNATLPWKVEWAAKFKVMNVRVEGAGKDHYTKGGSREVADHISHEVFSYEPPFGIQNEFFLIDGKKMSSSKGNASSSREIADLLPASIFRLVLIKNIKQQINFKPNGDAIPILFDTYDRLAEKFFNGVKDDDTRLFKFIHPKSLELKKRFLPRFSQIAFLIQMPHLSLEDEVERMKGSKLTKEDLEELNLRAKYAKHWISTYAPEDYKFELQKEIPKVSFSDKQKRALGKVLDYVMSNKKLDGQEMHTKLHEIRKDSNIEPKEFFSSIYLSFMGKESGPKAGWFLSVLDRDFLIKRLKETIK